MMLPEHVALLNEFFGEKKKVPKPELNEWDGEFHFRGGIIQEVDIIKRKISVDDPFGLHSYQLDSIVDVTVTE